MDESGRKPEMVFYANNEPQPIVKYTCAASEAMARKTLLFTHN